MSSTFVINLSLPRIIIIPSPRNPWLRPLQFSFIRKANEAQQPLSKVDHPWHPEDRRRKHGTSQSGKHITQHSPFHDILGSKRAKVSRANKLKLPATALRPSLVTNAPFSLLGRPMSEIRMRNKDFGMPLLRSFHCPARTSLQESSLSPAFWSKVLL